MAGIRQAGLLQHDRHLDAVGRGQQVELQPLGMLGGPFVGDGEGGQIGHWSSLEGERAMSALIRAFCMERYLPAAAHLA